MPSLRRRLLSAVQKTLEKGEEVANKKTLCGGLYEQRKLMRFQSYCQFYYVMMMSGGGVDPGCFLRK